MTEYLMNGEGLGYNSNWNYLWINSNSWNCVNSL